MPFMENGTPVDIVLNPLEFPNECRSGLGTHLGRVARGLSDKVNRLMEENNPAPKSKFLKRFTVQGCGRIFEKKDDQEIIEFAQKYQSGFHLATPVFDGAQEENITMAEMAEMPKSGRVWLHDGMTGDV